MTRRPALALLMLAFPLRIACAEPTITAVTPLPAVPVAAVSRSSLAPLAGATLAPERAPAEYRPEPAGRGAPAAVPMPTFNPAPVSFCGIG